ncbi:MAG: YhcH/YjgK/YiaL family protein [Smithellaceae bacterium]|nr:YhcH/YjgK/YiaL family protein [Smithellaceae bacterium]
MIIDRIGNIGSYLHLDKGIAAALEYVRNADFSTIAPGKYEIDGDRMFAIVSEYTTQDRRNCKLEAHRKYIDVQYVVTGSEWFGYAPLHDRIPASAYSDEQDEALYDGEASFIKFGAGMFAIFFPEDLHMPGTGKEPTKVKKVVVKVGVE